MRSYLGVSLTTAAGVVALVGMVGVGGAWAATIVGTHHDLTDKTGDPALTTRVCDFCHAPHNSADPAAGAPLWNRVNPDPTTFTMYTSPTMDMDVATGPQGVSLACLSCHDGVTAYDALINGIRVSGVGTIGGPSGDIPVPNDLDPDKAVGGGLLSLSDDHPISVAYDTTADPQFHDPTLGKVGGVLPLYGDSKDQVECASCHSVHDNTIRPFLRVSRDNSALCLTCHIK